MKKEVKTAKKSVTVKKAVTKKSTTKKATAKKVVAKKTIKTVKDLKQCEIIFDIVMASDGMALMDKLMHGCDIFDKNKRLAIVIGIKAYGRGEVTDVVLNHIISSTVKTINDKGGKVYFCGANSVDGVRKINPPIYFEKGISQLSMVAKSGLGWGLFKDILIELGYSPKTDKNMVVTSIK